jgi:sigma-B regulation protein RsbU (phosphoserine phosphatase)
LTEDGRWQQVSSAAASDRPNGTAEAAPVAVIVTDVAGRVLYWSRGAEQLYGWTAEETLGRHLDFLAGEELSDQVELIFAQLSRGERWQGRFPLRRKDGSPVEVDARDTPIEIDGVVVAILGESRAISEHDPSELITTPLPAVVSLDSIVGATARWYEEFLARSGSALSGTMLDEVLFDVLSPLARSLGADAISLLVANDDGSALTGRAAFGWTAELDEAVVIPAGRGVSGLVMSSRHPLIIAELDEVEVVSAALRHSGFRSYVGVPLIASDRVVGVLHATSCRPNRFDESHAATLAALAPHLAAAIDRVRRFEREQEGRRAAEMTAEQLAHAVRPRPLPVMAGLALAGRYVPAEAGIVGGDWYSAFGRPDGSVALVVGDVAGHGLDAVAGAALLRHALLAYLYQGDSASVALARLQRLVSGLSRGSDVPELATVLVACYDPASRRLVSASAGHPPWLQLRGHRGSFIGRSDLPLSPNLPVVTEFAEHVTEMEHGDLAVFYTDGLIEVRGQSLDDGLDRLRRSATEVAELEIEALSDALIAAMADAGRRDDLTLLVMRIA